MGNSFLELFKERDGSITVCLVMRKGGTIGGLRLSEDEAQHLSNRLQSLAKCQGDGRKEVLFK